MKNRLQDLNDHLFVQMERLNEEGLSEQKLQAELERTKGLTAVAREIIAVGDLALKAQIAVREYELKNLPSTLLLGKADG